MKEAENNIIIRHFPDTNAVEIIIKTEDIDIDELIDKVEKSKFIDILYDDKSSSPSKVWISGNFIWNYQTFIIEKDQWELYRGIEPEIPNINNQEYVTIKSPDINCNIQFRGLLWRIKKFFKIKHR